MSDYDHAQKTKYNQFLNYTHLKNTKPNYTNHNFVNKHKLTPDMIFTKFNIRFVFSNPYKLI